MYRVLRLPSPSSAGRRAAWVGVPLVVAGCLTADAFRTGSGERQFDVHCTNETQRAQRREDGIWECPNKAAYDSKSVGWIDDGGRYVQSVAIRPNPVWVNFCDSIALVSYGGYEPDIPWLIVWGDAEHGWGSAAQARTTTGYLDCRSSEFFYVDHSDCFVLERDRPPRAVPCGTPTFRNRDERWDFVDDPP